MDYRVIWDDPAIEDLRRVVEYIARDKPQAARQYGEKLVGRTLRLAQFPRLGRVVPEHGVEHVRELIVSPCRVVYCVHDSRQVVTVLMVWHSAQESPPRPLPTAGSG